ncbi:MAG: transcription elongation factor GreA [Clostridiales bacterium]|nr:transcription elongation factor GreA [Clostridiales bacterium]
MNNSLTLENIKKLREELEYRSTVKRAEIAREKLEAAAHGDRSENAEYKAACENYRNNDNRIQYLYSMISSATVIDNGSIDSSVLGLNSKARIRFVEDGDVDVITLVTTMDIDPAKMYISVEAELGKALLGKRTGDIAEVDAPNGKYTVEVMEILYE